MKKENLLNIEVESQLRNGPIIVYTVKGYHVTRWPKSNYNSYVEKRNRREE